MRGVTPDSHVPGVIACVGPDGVLVLEAADDRELILERRERREQRRQLEVLPSAAGVHLLMIAPCGK